MKLQIKSIAIGILLGLSAFLGWHFQPKEIPQDQRVMLDLESMIPQEIGSWRIDKSVTPIPPSPEVAAEINEIYAQVLERGYVNEKGQRIMLSIAYGSAQKDTLRVHPPEGCYAGQGFEVFDTQQAAIVLEGKTLPVTRFVSRKGKRYEPVTYWVTIGGTRAAATDFEQKLAKLAYGFTGQVPDGLLVRVSSIDDNAQAAFDLQQQFLQDLLVKLDSQSRTRIFGAGF